MSTTPQFNTQQNPPVYGGGGVDNSQPQTQPQPHGSNPWKWVAIMVIAVAGIAAGTIIATSQKKEAQPTEKDTVVVVKETANSAAPAAEAQKPTASKPAAQPAKQAIDNSNVSYGSQGPWHIRDLSGFTNIRNAPNGKVCMRLWDHTQYTIYTDAEVNGWLRMTYCYNESKGYQVRFHSSSTGSYWIHRSVLY